MGTSKLRGGVAREDEKARSAPHGRTYAAAKRASRALLDRHPTHFCCPFRIKGKLLPLVEQCVAARAVVLAGDMRRKSVLVSGC